MAENGVCAVVITFHPKEDVVENLRKLRPQIQHLILVDNGSSQEELAVFLVEKDILDFTLIENAENRGLPFALNMGMRRAAELQYEWVLLFDQDSTVTDGFVEALIATYRNHPRKKEIGLIAPLYVGRRSGNPIVTSPRFVEGGVLEAAMTSGSLIPMQAIRDHGGFDEQLVIDLLDYEFSLRLRSSGLILVQAPNARLLHEPGHPSSAKLFGFRKVALQNHSPARVYYRARNRLWISRKYRGLFPKIVLHNLKIQLKECLKIGFLETKGAKKTWFAIRGLIDGFHGRMGKTMEL